MCETCRTLENKVQNALLEGNPQKARVMASLLAGHCKNFHPYQNLTIVTPTLVTWPSGLQWIMENR